MSQFLSASRFCPLDIGPIYNRVFRTRAFKLESISGFAFLVEYDLISISRSIEFSPSFNFLSLKHREAAVETRIKISYPLFLGFRLPSGPAFNFNLNTIDIGKFVRLQRVRCLHRVLRCRMIQREAKIILLVKYSMESTDLTHSV